MHLAHRILLFSLIFFITACAHDPKQVEASRPLVTAINSSYSLIPEDLQAPLNNQDQGTTFNKNGVIYTIEERYISALGSQCIKLSYAMNKNYTKRSVVCKENNKWYQVPQLEQTSVSTLLIEE